MKADFPLIAAIPLPVELAASIEWISEVPTTTTTKFWAQQLEALKQLAADSAPSQKEWGTDRPHELGGDQAAKSNA